MNTNAPGTYDWLRFQATNLREHGLTNIGEGVGRAANRMKLLEAHNAKLRAALESVETAHQKCIEIHHLLESIYGSTNYAPIGSVLEKCLDDADAACEALQYIKAAIAETKGTG